MSSFVEGSMRNSACGEISKTGAGFSVRRIGAGGSEATAREQAKIHAIAKRARVFRNPEGGNIEVAGWNLPAICVREKGFHEVFLL